MFFERLYDKDFFLLVFLLIVMLIYLLCYMYLSCILKIFDSLRCKIIVIFMYICVYCFIMCYEYVHMYCVRMYYMYLCALRFNVSIYSSILVLSVYICMYIYVFIYGILMGRGFWFYNLIKQITVYYIHHLVYKNQKLTIAILLYIIICVYVF